MEEFLKLVKEFAFRRSTASERVNSTPAFLFSAQLTASNVGAATAVIRNGHDANAEAMIDLSAVSYTSDKRIFVPPIYFRNGLYVDFGLNVVSVLMSFRQTGDIEAAAGKRSLKSFLPSWLGGPAGTQKAT
jgi:hypothetical protein